MHNTTRRLMVAAAVLAVACGGKKPPEQPAPAPGPTAQEQARQDSIDAANRARAEQERLAKEAADRDAAIRAAMERDAAAVAAAEREASLQASLMQDLGIMIHFDFDKAKIKPADEANLKRKVAILAANGGVQIRLDGYCDERGSAEYNLALGNRRAASAKRYLVDHGVSADRITTASYGEERPLDPGHNETAWALNRRGEFEVTSAPDRLVAP
jgi:peptidoglycan-associated lipoprotein